MTTILPFVDKRAVFTPEVTHEMSVAFDEVCEALQLSKGSVGERESIAARIIELARCGEHNAARLRVYVLTEIRNREGLSQAS